MSPNTSVTGPNQTKASNRGHTKYARTPRSVARLSRGNRPMAANKIALSAANGSVQRHRRDRNCPVGNSSKIIGTQNAMAHGHDTFAQVAISRHDGRSSPACDPQASKENAAADPA